MSERIFFDSVSTRNIPRDAAGVLGYVDGLYKWSAADWALFPHSVKVRIAVFSQTNDGTVLDCERYDATPAQSVDWVLMRRKAGVDPTVYCNQMDPQTGWPAVRAAFRARKVQEPHYWVAKYDGVKQIPAGAIAKQYYNNEALNFDMSIVAAYWPGVDSPPAPAGNYPAWPGVVFAYDPKHPQMKYDGRVQTWQLQMRKRGWNLQADGFYGPASAATCLAFQKDSTAHGWSLAEDGMLGQHTWDATWKRPVSK